MVIYKVSNYYVPDHDKWLLWNDPDLGIAWPMPVGEAILSDKDRRQPRLAEIESPFEWLSSRQLCRGPATSRRSWGRESATSKS